MRLAALLWLAAATCAAQGAKPGGGAALPRHELHLNAAGEDLVPGSVGGALSVGWLYRPSPRYLSDVALASEAVEETRWSYVRASGSAWVRPRVVLRAGASLGAGEQGGAGIRYRRAVGAVGGILVPGRLYAEIESQYLDIAEVRGHLLKSELTGFLTPTASLSAAVLVSTSSALDVRAVTLRLDLHREGWSPFAGALLGRSSPAALQSLPGLSAPITSQAYLGVRVPVAGHSLTLVADRARAGEVRRLRLSVSWRIPL